MPKREYFFPCCGDYIAMESFREEFKSIHDSVEKECPQCNQLITFVEDKGLAPPSIYPEDYPEKADRPTPVEL